MTYAVAEGRRLNPNMMVPAAGDKLVAVDLTSVVLWSFAHEAESTHLRGTLPPISALRSRPRELNPAIATAAYGHFSAAVAPRCRPPSSCSGRMLAEICWPRGTTR